jgi:phosphoenolpyruvate carboxykinase (GTP)
MLERVDGAQKGREHAIGFSPDYKDLNWNGLDFSAEQFASVTSIDRDAWAAELKLHDELFAQLKQGLPKQLAETKAKIEARLAA